MVVPEPMIEPPALANQSHPADANDSSVPTPETETEEACSAKEPLVYYAARRPWELIQLEELWQHRDLIWILGMRDLQVRYRQTLVGVIWAVLQPLASMLIFTTLFTLMGKTPASEGVPYSLALLCGLAPWQLFATIVTQATTSLVANQGMVSKVYFPRLVLPLATALPATVDFMISCSLILIGLAVYQIWPSWSLLLAPLFVALVILTGLAVGIWFAALNAIYRDIGFVVPFLIQLGFFASPVIYHAESLIPPGWQLVYWLNPMAGLVEGFRWSISPELPFPAVGISIGLITTTVVFGSGLAYFRRIERYVADCI